MFLILGSLPSGASKGFGLAMDEKAPSHNIAVKMDKIVFKIILLQFESTSRISINFPGME